MFIYSHSSFILISSRVNNLFVKVSIKIAPKGAVTKIATTAAVKINVPHGKPSFKAIPPIEA